MIFNKMLGKVVVVNDLEDLFKYINKLIVPEVVIFEDEEYKAEFTETGYYVRILLKRIRDLGFRKVREIEMYKDGYAIITKIGYHYHYNGKSEFVLDRENGPALIRKSLGNFKTLKEISWNKDNKLHRTDGPAYILYDDNGDVINTMWYINDRELDEFEIEVLNANNNAK